MNKILIPSSEGTLTFTKGQILRGLLEFDSMEPDKMYIKWSELAKWLHNNGQINSLRTPDLDIEKIDLTRKTK